MARRTVSWTITPSRGIAAELAKRTAAMEPALAENAATHASRGETTMKQNRPWTDRTGHARGSLYGRADGTTVHLGTTNSEYGIFLELGTSRMAARPIIQPTANEAAPDYFEDAADIVRGLIGGGR